MKQNPSALEAIAMMPLFAGIAEDELSAFVTALAPIEIKAGKYLIRQGSDETDIYLIQSGKVKVSRADAHGKEVILALQGPGDVVGEIALLTDSKRVADVVALTTCNLWSLSREAFFNHASKFSGIAVALLRYLAYRVKAASIRIGDLALYDLQSRVARVLLELSTIIVQEESPVHVIIDRPTHQDLASMVGASREAVTRALSTLEEAGHIEIEDNRIWLHSIPLL